MTILLKTKSMVVLASCISLFCSFLPDCSASQGVIRVQPKMAQILLSMAGLETEIVELDRADGFDRTLYLGSLQGKSVSIGFPTTGVARGVPFLLTVEGEEIMVALSEDGMIEVVGGDASAVPSSIIDALECLLDTLVDLVRDILESNLNVFNIIVLVVNGVFRILGCILSIF